MITPNENVTAETRTPLSREAELFRAAVDKPFARVSWGAIFAGALTALGTLLILSLLGLGIGLSTLDPATGDNPSGAAIGIGAVVWWIVSSVIALFVGGYVSGRLAGNFNGYLHGLVAWATVTLITMMLLSSAIGSAFAGASGLAQFIAQAAPTVSKQAPGVASQLQSQAQESIDRMQSQAQNPSTRAQTEQQVREVGQKAARGGAMGSFGAALALLLGAGSAIWGGIIGKRRFIEVVPERKDLMASNRF